MEDLLQCPICYCEYNTDDRSPRQLNNCQHILCSSCLPHMLKQPNQGREHIECPICKDKLHVQISQVPKSLVLMQVMEATKRTTTTSNTNTATTNRNGSNNNDDYGDYNNQSRVYSQNSYATSPSTSTNSKFFSPPVIPPRPDFPEPEHTFKTTNPFYSDYNESQNQHTQQHNNVEPWDIRKFLRTIFNEMDMNGDGTITSNELREALRRGQSMNEFNLKTIQLLISRYDKNGDMEINFDEFFDLYCNLNEEFESFLIMDMAGSGYIDQEEFCHAMTNKGYNFSQKFFKFIVGEIGKHSNSRGIKFDNYIRAMARFDYLCEYYKKTPYFHNNHNLESYLKNTFFQDFW